MTPHLSLASIVVASPDQVSSDLAGDTVLLSLKSAQYHGLDDVGSRIWALIQEPTTVQALVDQISVEYDVSAAQCESDLLAFLRELATRDLIEVRSAP